MALVEETVLVPKEMQDVRVFLVQLMKDIKAKKGVAEIAAGSLGNLMAAVEGYDQLDDEAKLSEAYNLYGLLVADIAKVLSGKAA